MVEPAGSDRLGHPAPFEDLAEDGEPPIELTAHDPVRPVRHLEGSPAVGRPRAEVLGGVLVLEALHARAIRAGEEEADHEVVEAAVDELVDDRPQRGLPAELLEVGHARSMPPIRSLGEPRLSYHRRRGIPPLAQSLPSSS